MKMFALFCVFALLLLQKTAVAKDLPCQKEAEKIAIDETRKKGNFPAELQSPSLPTEMDGDSIVVYIGAHANYNYFKMKLDKTCHLIKIEDVEYATP
jgi:hypothetical protein